MNSIKIVGIIGSLRKGSLNRMLVNAIKELAPQGMTVEIAEIGNLPLFNQDLEANFPKEAQELKDKISAADSVIIATPEYDRSVPGVLKNALDWTSRPYGQSAWPGKVVAVVGASGGAIGTAVAQSHLKQILLYLDARVLGQPEFYLGGAVGKFDKDGKLTDETTKERIAKLLDVLGEKIRQK